MAWWAKPVKDGHDVRPEFHEILEQSQAVAARAEVPVEHRKVDRMLIGDQERRLRVRDCEDSHGEPTARQPFLERSTNGILVVHDEDSFAHGELATEVIRE